MVSQIAGEEVSAGGEDFQIRSQTFSACIWQVSTRAFDKKETILLAFMANTHFEKKCRELVLMQEILHHLGCVIKKKTYCK